jgi:hypothetical protein
MPHRVIKIPNLPVKSFLAYSSAVVFGAFASIAAARTETGAVVLGLVAVVALIVGYLGRDQEKPLRKDRHCKILRVSERARRLHQRGQGAADPESAADAAEGRRDLVALSSRRTPGPIPRGFSFRQDV